MKRKTRWSFDGRLIPLTSVMLSRYANQRRSKPMTGFEWTALLAYNRRQFCLRAWFVPRRNVALINKSWLRICLNDYWFPFGGKKNRKKWLSFVLPMWSGERLDRRTLPFVFRRRNRHANLIRPLSFSDIFSKEEDCHFQSAFVSPFRRLSINSMSTLIIRVEDIRFFRGECPLADWFFQTWQGLGETELAAVRLSRWESVRWIIDE